MGLFVVRSATGFLIDILSREVYRILYVGRCQTHANVRCKVPVPVVCAKGLHVRDVPCTQKGLEWVCRIHVEVLYLLERFTEDGPTITIDRQTIFDQAKCTEGHSVIKDCGDAQVPNRYSCV
jgi:hypothetical protein